MPHGTNEHSKHKLHHLANCYYCHRYDIVASEFERCIGGRNYSSIGQKQESKNLRVFGKGCIFSKVERKGKANFTKLHLFSKSLGPQWLWNSHEPVSELTVYTSRVGPQGSGNGSTSRVTFPVESPGLTPRLPQPASQNLADLSPGSPVFNLPGVCAKAGSLSGLKEVACLSAFPQHPHPKCGAGASTTWELAKSG